MKEQRERKKSQRNNGGRSPAKGEKPVSYKGGLTKAVRDRV